MPDLGPDFIAGSGIDCFCHARRFDRKRISGLLSELNRCTSGRMRTIDILVSAASDVQKESAIAEHLICSLAAEFDLPVSISYSNRLREVKEDVAVERKDPEDDSTPVVRLSFWDCPALEGDDLPEPEIGRAHV